MAAPQLNRDFDPSYGKPVKIADGLFRLTAENPSPFTFFGTNGYMIGERNVIIVDPGPDLPGHFDHWIRAIAGRRVIAIAITHTHLDHTPMAHRLKAESGAPIAGFGPHLASRPLRESETNPFAESSDMALVPDIKLSSGDKLVADNCVLEAVHTPGHTANHLAFALAGTPYLLSGDHVMAWSTTIVSPPDGSMRDYMASLETMLQRPETIYLPGHGGPVLDARDFVRGIRSHRLMRERAILNRLETGDTTIAEMVAVMYAKTEPKLHGAAALSVLAHLEYLIERGIVASYGHASLKGKFRLVAPAGK